MVGLDLVLDKFDASRTLSSSAFEKLLADFEPLIHRFVYFSEC